jgi:hypothetical protein
MGKADSKATLETAYFEAVYQKHRQQNRKKNT